MRSPNVFHSRRENSITGHNMPLFVERGGWSSHPPRKVQPSHGRQTWPDVTGRGEEDAASAEESSRRQRTEAITLVKKRAKR